MKKLTPSNLIFGLFLILMLIPTTRKFIQVNIQKVLAKVIPAKANIEEGVLLSTYDFSFKGINTKDLRTTDIEGEVLFINFWATWCPPCIAEMPDMQELYNIYGDKIHFAFVTNDSPEKINSFLNKNNLTIPVYQYQSKLPKELNHKTIPTTFIIDKKGKIVLHKKGVANWNSDRFYKELDKIISL